MIKSLTLAAIILPVLLGACTPLSETIVRKPTADPADGRQSEAMVRSLNREQAVYAQRLDALTQSLLHSYGHALREYSERYGVDWRLVLAVMKNESGFMAEAVSPKGASGFMQIMPVTGMELARTLELESLNNPVDNIHGGIFYLQQLHSLFHDAAPFDRIRLTLAAYNAGIGRIYDAQEMVAYFHGNPMKWNAVRETLPLLSKSYCELHKDIWTNERPRSGWFGNSRETLDYVERIMESYDEYCSVLN